MTIRMRHVPAMVAVLAAAGCGGGTDELREDLADLISPRAGQRRQGDELLGCAGSPGAGRHAACPAGDNAGARCGRHGQHDGGERRFRS